MGPTGYYSPGIIGALVGLVYAVFGGGDGSAAERAMLGCVLVPVLFLVCQLLMFAAQGIFARVLPAPFGRSVRGRKCLAIGMLIIAALVSSLVFGLVSRVQFGTAAMVVGGVSALCWLAAIGVYVWSLPTALADFVEKRGM